MSSLRTHTFEHGLFKCYVLEEGNFSVVLETEFDSEEKKILSSNTSSNLQGTKEVEIGFNYLLVDTGSSKILIDTGKGNGELVQALKSININPADIHYIVITHADNDHIGGIHCFPNAQLVIPKKAYDMWTSETARSILIRDAYEALVRIFPEDMMQLSNEAKEQYGKELLPSFIPSLVLAKDNEEFLPGITLFPTPGHRGDHYCLEIISEDKKLIVLGDAIRHKFQLDHPELPSLYDSNKKEWAQSIKLINEKDPRKKALYFGTHVCFPGVFSRL